MNKYGVLTLKNKKTGKAVKLKKKSSSKARYPKYA